MNDKLGKNKEKKAKVVAEISEKVGKSKLLVFTNYQGMTHQQIEGMKKALKPVGGEFSITKNRLLARAYPEQKDILNKLEGPTGTMFAYSDPIMPLKELVKTIKKLKLPAIKFGIFEGKELSEEEINKLSTLPSKDVLIARLLGGMKAPINNLVFVLNANMQKFVMTLKAIEKTKQ
ncbi:MAG: 50S ribosomal protein L10 [Patescibacteria group bacterium]|nr:50S ribosomal protein L10 [Patescibacteria group bacterium]